jgi:uncharacterized protein YdhG (YjbR/CyaY superfamily)
MTRSFARDVDTYLARLPEETRATLDKLRKIIKAAAPKAEEVISYQIPAYKYHGMLVGFAGFPNHCSFFVMKSSFLAAFKDELKGYDLSTGTIRFPIGKPLPSALVKKLVKARVAENEARAKLKGKRAGAKVSVKNKTRINCS